MKRELPVQTVRIEVQHPADPSVDLRIVSLLETQVSLLRGVRDLLGNTETTGRTAGRQPEFERGPSVFDPNSML